MAEFLNNCLNYVHARISQPCLLCGARCHGSPLCPACLADLPRLPATRCPQCALPTPTGEVCGACLKRPPRFDRCRAVYAYVYPADVLVKRLKYASELALAGFLAEQLAQEVAPHPLPDLILPMPLHPRRLGERGFNQAVELGRRLSARLGVPMRRDACQRMRDTPAQAGLDLKERRRNLRGAFHCGPDLKGLRVALLDDVMTSGASLDELARAARNAGAIGVEAWVVARTLPP
ncbi:MAG: ComF family protein [Thiobacillaceae bacterium]